jgi:hypothetical protein
MKLADIPELYNDTKVWQIQGEPVKLTAWQNFMKVLAFRFYAARLGALIGELFEELDIKGLEFKLSRTTFDTDARWAVKHSLELLEQGKFDIEDFKTRYQKCQAYANDMMVSSINPSIGLYLRYKDRTYSQHIHRVDIISAIKMKDGLSVFKAAFPDLLYKLEFNDVPEELKLIQIETRQELMQA